MADTVWAYKGQTYRFVKVGKPQGGFDIFRVGVGWIAWTAGSAKDARDTVRSMADGHA